MKDMNSIYQKHSVYSGQSEENFANANVCVLHSWRKEILKLYRKSRSMANRDKYQLCNGFEWFSMEYATTESLVFSSHITEAFNRVCMQSKYKWDIPWYTTRKICIFILYYVMENTWPYTNQRGAWWEGSVESDWCISLEWYKYE